MAVSQALTLTETSYNASENTSKVRILWQSTQTGDSRNGYTRTAYYYVTVNGGQEEQYSVSYTLPRNTTKTIVDTTITVKHRDDGSGTVIVRTWMDTGISAGIVELDESVDLTAVARASLITSATNVTLGETGTTVKWIPASTALHYKIVLNLGDWGWTSEAIHPYKATEYAWTSPILNINLASQVTGNPPNRTMTVFLYTYSDYETTKQVGYSSSTNITATVPFNKNTEPTLSMTLTPVNSLPAPFSTMYLQGFSKVKATFSGEGKYDATISSYALTVGGTTYGSPYTSAALQGSGEVTVIGKAFDSRGYYGTAEEKIAVIPYSKPRVVPASGEGSIVCARCDSSGKLTSSGTYLLIKAGRSYSTVTVDGTQNNFCTLRYRYRNAASASFSAWKTLLASNNTATNSYTSSPISSVVSSVSTAYVVEIGVVDSIGETTATSVSFTIPTDNVSIDIPEKYEGKRIGIGGYAKESDEPGIDMGAPVYGGALDSLKIGTRLVATSSAPISLDDYKTAGVFYSSSSGESKYITNAPTTGSGFRLEVREVEGASLIRQTAFYSSSIAIRNWNGAVWSAWRYFLSTFSSDASVADFVTERGTSGVWVYEKYNSGIVKLWGSGTATYENGNVLSASLKYPITLTSAISGIGTINSYGGNAASALPWNIKLAYGSSECKAWIHNTTAGFTSSSTVEVSVCIVGKWK